MRPFLAARAATRRVAGPALRCVAAMLLLVTAVEAAEKPNIIVILSDDQGWGDLSIHGNTNLETPQIDSLARDGALLERFYVCPVCSPTRAEFLTGRYHPRTGVRGVTSGGERMDLGARTLGDVFRAAGYATATFGKWHNGTQYPYHPNGRGFELFYGFTSGHWGDYFSPPLDRNGRIVRGNGYLTDDFTDQALQFIEQQKNGPFFAYLAYNTPHSPMQVPERWWNKFKDKPLALRGTEPEREDLDHTRAALAMCENIDWNVGRILDRLEELALAENTIVLFFADNGPNGHRWNGGLKGIKGSTDEGGVRSPLLVRWPAQIPGGTRVREIAAAIDLLPTLADLADVPFDHSQLDGQTLEPLLLSARGAPQPSRAENGPRQPADSPSSSAYSDDRLIFSHWAGRVSVCNQRFRLDHAGKLYDLLADPGQRTEVSAQHPTVKSNLAAAVRAWKREVFANPPKDEAPFLVGHPNFPLTQLPARDAEPHGSIERSSRHPNCSFLTNWTSTGDRITWHVEVLVSGEYEVDLYYTCPQSDVGAEVELAFNGTVVRGMITEAHDPPLVGAEHDRVPRTESYVKDFRPLKLGRIHLEEGRGELTLRALRIPGAQVMDFRLMTLTRDE